MRYINLLANCFNNLRNTDRLLECMFAILSSLCTFMHKLALNAPSEIFINSYVKPEVSLPFIQYEKQRIIQTSISTLKDTRDLYNVRVSHV